MPLSMSADGPLMYSTCAHGATCAQGRGSRSRRPCERKSGPIFMDGAHLEPRLEHFSEGPWLNLRNGPRGHEWGGRSGAGSVSQLCAEWPQQRAYRIHHHNPLEPPPLEYRKEQR